MLAWFYVCIAAVRRSLRFPALAFAVSIFWLLLAQWLTTSASCCCTAAASRLPILRCMQRYELQSYDEMQAPSQPGKLVHHLASTRQRVLPGTPRRAANATRQTRRVSIMRNPHVWKKAVGIDTRILRASRRATESFAHESQPTPPPRLCSQPRAAPRRHHCRARGPEGHRRQDV